jgi:glucose-1-phosphate thymidylyltransferase
VFILTYLIHNNITLIMIKGLILAGGMGKRLSPTTDVINKHFLSIYDKPMIYYPLSILMCCKIKDITIVCNKEDKKKFLKIFSNGEHLGLKLSYVIQSRPEGIVNAIDAAKKNLINSSIFCILGDNLFYGNRLTELLRYEIKKIKKITIFSYLVKVPKNYGVIEYSKKGSIKKIHEKPKKFISNKAVTGIYLLDKSILKNLHKIKKSKRNEFEITDLLNLYVKKGLKEKFLQRGYTWFDTGSYSDLISASNFVNLIESRQNLKLGCIEETAYKEKFINKSQYLKVINNIKNPDYKNYLKESI